MKISSLILSYFLYCVSTFASHHQPRNASVNALCAQAKINKLVVDAKLSGVPSGDLCLASPESLPAVAKEFLLKLTDIHRKAIELLGLPVEDPFKGGMNIEIKVDRLGPLLSAFENEGNIIILGTERNAYLKSFSKTIYMHELGHWYLFNYLPRSMNLPTLHELFADSLALSAYGRLDYSEMGLPLCLSQVREHGPDVTYEKPIKYFDYGSAFRRSAQCCSSLQGVGSIQSSRRVFVPKHRNQVSFFPGWRPRGISCALKSKYFFRSRIRENGRSTRTAFGLRTHEFLPS